ncbi:MAG TPA: hypothetical protein VEJ89_12350 [Myxococcaceae bacterium]|nr:hypothetical protein [Myxococcaceae bacterium]
MSRRPLLLAIVLSAACGSNPNPPPPPPSTGMLRIELSAPQGLAAAVRVTGPGGMDRVLTGSETLELEPGSYAVAANDVRFPGEVVDTLFRGTVSGPGEVTAGRTTTVQVAYARRPGTGGLWLAASGVVDRGLSRFDDLQLRTSGGPAPAVSLSPGFYPSAVAFDGEGALWTTDSSFASGVLFRLAPEALDHSHAPLPDRVLGAAELPSGRSLSLAGIQALAFDASGHLWVANCAPGYGTGLVRFTPAQLARSGAPVPPRVLGESLFTCAGDVALDPEGGLWALNSESLLHRGRIHGWTRDQVALADDVPPAVSLAGSPDALRLPTSLAFDASGNLWVANCSVVANNNQLLPATVERYSAAARAASGPARPEVVLTGFVCPVGLAFDNAGALWVHDADALSRLYRFLPHQLTETGAPTPAVAVTAGPSDTGRPVLHPRPAALALD